MSLHVALQIDPLAKLNLRFDTSLTLAYEAQLRGHVISYYYPHELSFKMGKVMARARRLNLAHDGHSFIPEEGDERILDLSEVDVVIMRQNPPFDMTYLTNTYLLDQIAHRTLVLNNPTGVRNSVEKLLPLEFPNLIPPTLISQDWEEINHFCHAHEEVILKPLLDFGGHSVFLVKAKEGQLKSLYQLLSRSYPGLPFIVQPFLEEVLTGDKRIILMDGELVGGYRRVPPQGEVRSNQLMGGSVEKCDLSARDIEICETIGPRLRALGLFFVGIDVIGNYLIEINVTSPTGLVPLKQLNGIKAEAIFWDKAEKIIDKGEHGSQYYNSSFSGNRRSTH
jgi:glutathione synthase